MTVSAHTEKLVADYGWRVGNTGENRVALALHRAGFRPRARGVRRDWWTVDQQYVFAPFRVDFLLVGINVALEADGWVHRSRDVRQRDLVRDVYLASRGVATIRVNVDDEDEIALIVEALAERTRERCD